MDDPKCCFEGCKSAATLKCDCQKIILCEDHVVKHIAQSESFESHPISQIKIENNEIAKTPPEEDLASLKDIGIDVTPYSFPVSCIAVAGSFVYSGERDGISKINVETNFHEWKFKTPCVVWRVAVLRDERYVAGGLDSGSIIVLNPTGVLVKEIEALQDPVTSIIFTNNSSFLCAASSNLFFLALNVGENFRTHLYKREHQKNILCMSADLTSRYAFTGSADGKIVAWDLMNKNKVNELEAHKGEVTSLGSFQSNLISAGFDGVVNIWNLNDWTKVREITNYRKKIYSMTVNSSGTIYITDSRHYLKGFEFNGKPLGIIYDGEELFTGIVFNERKKMIYGISGERTVKKYKAGGLVMDGTIGNYDLVVAKITDDYFYLVCGFKDGWVKWHNLITSQLEYDNYYLELREVFSRYPELGLGFEEVK